jgi:hypothetical protein
MRTRTSYALLLALIVACSGNGIAPWGSLKTAVLHYTAMSGRGVPLVAGSLRLVVHDDSIVAGTWSIDWVPGADTTARVGPQVGSGTFAGEQLADGAVHLNLNPSYADNNVLLSATVTRDGLAGEWSWSGFPGVLGSGPFTATYVASP